MDPQAANLTLRGESHSPKREGVSQTNNGRATHAQDPRLVQVQPQSILLHPLQYSFQAALKGWNGIHCGWRKGDAELDVISVLLVQSPTPPDDPTQQPHVDIKQHWEDNQALWNPTIEIPWGQNTLPKLSLIHI